MNPSQPRQEDTKNEREFVATLVALGMPEDLTLPVECFADIPSQEVLNTAYTITKTGGICSQESVLDQLNKNRGSLKCHLGDATIIATMGEQPMADDLKASVCDAYRTREARATISKAEMKASAGGDPREIIAEIKDHTEISFGSFGSLDLSPTENLIPFPIELLGDLPHRFSAEIARSELVTESLAAASVLGIISSAIGSSLRV